VFNDASFIDLVSLASNAGYQTSMVVLFLDNLSQSIKRVAARGIAQNGIVISGANVKINFEESFKNIANYFFYFDGSNFIYTGLGEVNELIMSFHKDELISHVSNDLVYPKRFAEYSHRNHRLSDEAYQVISANQNL
jgi:predicted ABC-type ATPase